MKAKAAAFGLLVLVLVLSLALASADGLVVYLSGESLDATSIAINWLCTDKEDPAFTVSSHVAGVDRTSQWLTYRNYYVINHVLPGTTYVISVSSSTTQTVTVTTPEADDYGEFNYQLLDTGLYKTYAGEEDYTALTALNSKTLPGEIYDYDFNFMFRFSLTASNKQKALPFELMLELPNGDVYALSDILWYGVRSETYTQYYSFNGLLAQVMADYDGFPTGDYTLYAYFDDDFAAGYTFLME